MTLFGAGISCSWISFIFPKNFQGVNDLRLAYKLSYIDRIKVVETYKSVCGMRKLVASDWSHGESIYLHAK